MNMDDMKLGDIKAIAACFQGSTATPFKVGEKYLIRTVTNYFTGRVVEIVGNFVVLDTAAWIADTGVFSKSLADGSLEEVEPYPGQCIVALTAVIDACVWAHDLPAVKK